MSQQAKKSGSAGQASAKAASGAGKVASTAFSAAESTKAAAQNVVDISATAMRGMLSSSTGEAQKAQEKMWDMGRESVENMARGCDMFTRMCMEMVGIYRDNVEAMIECCNTTAGMVKNLSAEVSEICNKSFSEGMELSKEAFACRTLNDVAELQNRAMKQTVDTCFSETSKLCNMAFECCTEALEPLNERMYEASEQMCKAMAA